MYRFKGNSSKPLVQAQNLAAVQLAHLQASRPEICEEEAVSFLAREILRLHREGEHDPQKLANRAISLLREHLQTRDSARRLARPADSN